MRSLETLTMKLLSTGTKARNTSAFRCVCVCSASLFEMLRNKHARANAVSIYLNLHKITIKS